MPETLDRLQQALADRYAIKRVLGVGGMATVYLARDLRHDRDVAVKVLRPDVALSLGRDRFLREIHIAARLQHPNILPVYDSGEAGGYLYYVMPFVDGESLRERLRQRHCIEVGAGLGSLAGKVIRIGLMGQGARLQNVLRVLAALGEALAACGRPVDVAAALAVAADGAAP